MQEHGSGASSDPPLVVDGWLLSALARQYSDTLQRDPSLRLEQFLLSQSEELELSEADRVALLMVLLPMDAACADNRGMDRRPLASYLQALPEYEVQLRGYFAEAASRKIVAPQVDTDEFDSPVAEPEEWKADQQVAGYRLQRRLGQGGYGEVWLAEDEQGQQVALKTIALRDTKSGDLKSAGDRDVAAASLDEEARTLRLFSGRDIRIPKFHGMGRTRGRPWVAMEYVSGCNLQSRPAEGVWDWQRCVRVMISLAETVGKMHQFTVYHFDLKPSNVILDPQDQAWVIDLGSATSWDQMNELKTGELPPTTKGYAPPELLKQGNHRQFSAQSEIFYMGVMLYELLTGKAPFPTTPLARHNFEKRRGRPQCPSELHCGLPQAVDDLCLRMLDQDVTARPRNCDVVIQQLRQALAEAETIPVVPVIPLPLVQPPPTPEPAPQPIPPPQAGWRWPRTPKRLMLLMLAGLGGLMLLLSATIRGNLIEEVPVQFQEPKMFPGTVIPPQVHHRDLGGGRIEYGNIWVAARPIWDMNRVPGRYKVTVELHVTGDWQVIGLAHSIRENNFQMLSIGRKPGDQKSVEIEYGSFAITNPPAFESQDKTGDEQTERVIGGHLVHDWDGEQVFRADADLRSTHPNLTLGLEFHGNVLETLTVNGANPIDCRGGAYSPAFQGKIYLLIDGTSPPDDIRGPARVEYLLHKIERLD